MKNVEYILGDTDGAGHNALDEPWETSRQNSKIFGKTTQTEKWKKH